MEPQSNNNQPTQNAAESTSAAEMPKVEETKTTEVPKGDVSEYRIFAVVGYILPFLFFLPLLDEKTKNVEYVRFHANQQLIVLIVGVAAYMLQGFIFGLLLSLGYYVVQLINLALLVLMVIGAINGYKGEMKELPVVGQFKILK